MIVNGIDIVMAVEYAFQFDFEDYMFEDEMFPEIITVGDFYQFLLNYLNNLNQLDNSSKPKCLMSHTFYRLRSALINGLGIPRHQIFPKQKIVTLFPKSKRRARWKAFAKELGLQLPELCRPLWFSSLVIHTVLFWLIGSFLGMIFEWLTVWETGISIGLVVGLTWFIYWLSQPLANYFESETTTLGEMTRIVLYQNLNKIRSSLNKKYWNEKEVWEVYQLIIVQKTGVKSKQVIKFARFEEDLEVYW